MRKHRHDMNEVYPKVLSLIQEKGLTVKKACSEIGLDRSTLYLNISLEQKKNIKVACLLKSAVGGNKPKSGLSLSMTRNVNEGFEYLGEDYL